MKKSASTDLHGRITQQIVDIIESGAGVYQMPWHNAEGTLSVPKNPIGNYCYHGINILSLWAARQKYCFTTNQWATYRQWASVGAQVRREEKGTPTVFYRPVVAGDNRETDMTENKKDAEPHYGRPFITKMATVFNSDQVDGYSPETIDVSEELCHDKAEKIIIGSGARILWGGNRACYIPSRDEIHLPPLRSFISSDAYYGVAFHELTHWTGHQSRCARDLTNRFGSSSYAMEELIAELGAAFFSAESEVSLAPRVDHAQYIASWLEVMKQDNKAIFTAAAKANEACSFVLSILNDKN